MSNKYNRNKFFDENECILHTTKKSRNHININNFYVCIFYAFLDHLFLFLVSKLQTSIISKEDELTAAMSQTDGKVDKTLIKNLIVGFVTCNNNLNKDQTQILKIIGTVLDFNQQDHDKLKLNKELPGSWLSSLLSPQSNFQTVGQESLSRAFIEFLEKESKPREVPSLLSANGETAKPSSRSSTPKQITNLSEIVLPTFADFAQNRNSSSILKDVMKDNS